MKKTSAYLFLMTIAHDIVMYGRPIDCSNQGPMFEMPFFIAGTVLLMLCMVWNTYSEPI